MTDDAARVALAFYDNVVETFSADPPMQELAAKASRRHGYSRMVRGYRKGRENYRQAIRIYEEISARSPGYIWLRTGLIATLQEYAGLLTASEDAVEADVSIRRALEVANALIGNKDAGQPCFRHGLVDPLNRLSRGLVRRPARPGDASLAVRLARQAVDWEPAEAALWNTLGIAYYRAGDWSAAESALQKSVDLKGGGDAADCFCLAAIQHHHGDITQANQCYDRAVAWIQQNPDPGRTDLAELRWFRDEVANVLGLPERTGKRPQRPPPSTPPSTPP